MNDEQTIGDDRMVAIHYTLRGAGNPDDPNGGVIDSSRNGEPLEYLHGGRQIVPGLENALRGRRVGDRLDVKLSPEDAYGPHKPELVSDYPRNRFPAGVKLVPGAMFQANTPDGPRTVTVAAVSDEAVTVDANHPLAGTPLQFDVEVISVRPATPDERHAARGH